MDHVSPIQLYISGTQVFDCVSASCPAAARESVAKRGVGSKLFTLVWKKKRRMCTYVNVLWGGKTPSDQEEISCSPKLKPKCSLRIEVKTFPQNARMKRIYVFQAPFGHIQQVAFLLYGIELGWRIRKDCVKQMLLVWTQFWTLKNVLSVNFVCVSSHRHTYVWSLMQI